MEIPKILCGASWDEFTWGGPFVTPVKGDGKKGARGKAKAAQVVLCVEEAGP